MNEPAWDLVKKVFHAAVQCSAEDRAALLASACGDDAELRAEVEGLLAAHEEAGPGNSAGIVAPEASGVDEGLGGVIGRYQLLGTVGEGGMGAILMVRDEELRRNVAMKVLLGRVTRESPDRPPLAPDRLARFLEEAQVTAQLAHPGVVPVHELGVDETGRVFFTMSLVRGKTLSEIITLARGNREGWDRPRALNTLLRVCETMAFAHDKGVIHRDLKPANIMVGKFGEVYVMDWGLAKVRGQEDRHDIRLRPPDAPTSTRIQTDRTESESDHDSPIMTMDGAVVGTPCYMPPEQAKGRVEEVDERSDIYAIGGMLYQLLTGRPPYIEPGARISPRTLLVRVLSGPPQPIQELAPDAPPELRAIADKAMERDRAARYESAKSLAEDVQRFLSGHVVQAHKTGALVELRKWLRRNRRFAALTVLATVVVATLISYFLYELGAAHETIAAYQNTANAPGEVRDAKDAANDARLERLRALGATSEPPPTAPPAADEVASVGLGLLLAAADRDAASPEEARHLNALGEMLGSARPLAQEHDGAPVIVAGLARLDDALNESGPGQVLGPESRLQPASDPVLVRTRDRGYCALFPDADWRTEPDGSQRLVRGRAVVALGGAEGLLLPVGALAAPGQEAGNRWCATVNVLAEVDGVASAALTVTHGECELRRDEFAVLLMAGDEVVVTHGPSDERNRYSTSLAVRTSSVGVVEWRRREAKGIIAAYVPRDAKVVTDWILAEGGGGGIHWPWDSLPFGYFVWTPGNDSVERLEVRVPSEPASRASVEIATYFPRRDPQQATLAVGTFARIDISSGVVATDLWPYAIVLIGLLLGIGAVVVVRRA